MRNDKSFLKKKLVSQSANHGCKGILVGAVDDIVKSLAPEFEDWPSQEPFDMH